MPELPEVAALAAFLTDHATGQRIAAVTVASLNVMTTYDPPTSALVGRVVTGVGRRRARCHTLVGMSLQPAPVDVITGVTTSWRTARRTAR